MSTKKYRIGFYSSAPLDDRRNWSGTMFKMYEQIAAMENATVEWMPVVRLDDREERTLQKIANTYYKIFNRGYNKLVNVYKSKRLAKKIDEYITDKDFDLLFIPTAIVDFAFVKTKIPVVYLNDANVAQLLNYYPYYSGFGYLSKLETKYIEKKLLKKAAAVVLPSEWAVDFVSKEYKINPKKVYLLRFGPNMSVPEKLPEKRISEEYHTLLFLGVDWVRKGGDIALKAAELLVRKGYAVKLLVVGCIPPTTSGAMEVIPFLDKKNPDEYRKLQELLITSALLLLPTRAECYGIVFCEAAAYGLPVISTDTGGISSVVIHGKTGLLLPPTATAEDYAEEISTLLSSIEKKQQISQNARLRYEDQLNWGVFGVKIRTIFNELLTK